MYSDLHGEPLSHDATRFFAIFYIVEYISLKITSNDSLAS